jgi:SAM-dependent methyltransferase
MSETAVDVNNLDAPETTAARGGVILSKPLLKYFYDRFYHFVKSEYKGGFWVELGSGAGFIKLVIPDMITSDYLELPGQDMRLDATAMPFENNSVDGLCMMNVLHHIQDTEAFFAEAVRVLKPGGKVVMQEPANTLFSRFIYTFLHHEPFDTVAVNWKLPPGGPLSMANGALPWIIFKRDRQRFEALFPELEIRTLYGVHPVLYLASGGFSARQLVPSWMEGIVIAGDRLLARLPWFPLFKRIVLVKRAGQ